MGKILKGRIKMFKKNNTQLHQSTELSEANYEAFDLLAERIKTNISYIEYEFQKSIDKEIELNKSAFSMYLSTLISLKNTLDYEITKYGNNRSENDMEIYKSLEDFIEGCRMLVTNNSFEFNEASFSLKISESQGISTNEIKRYIFNSLANQY